jgi:hypothetical protein
MSQLTDTRPEAERVLTDDCLTLSMGEKWLRIGRRIDLSRRLHASRFRRLRPGATDREILEDYMYLTLGAKLVEELRAAGRI